MANNYSYCTVEPNIPKDLLTPDQIKLLECSGFVLENCSNGSYYLYADSCLIEDKEYLEEIVQVCEGERIEPVLWYDLLESLITEELKEFCIMGAYTCDKMRPGEFGGWVCRITKDNIQWDTTYASFARMREEHPV